MVTAIMLLNAQRTKIKDVAQKLVVIPGVKAVYSVAGRYDLVAQLWCNSNEELAELVTSRVTAIEGISQTETLIAFEVYSQYDLERMFSIGMEEAETLKAVKN